MIEARYYTKEDDYINCFLCPHNCKIPEEKTGVCKVRKNIKGELYTLNYETMTSYGYDPIEKKPLFHFYPGADIFSFGTFGCNFNCDFCQNISIVENVDMYLNIEVDEILELAKAKGSIGIAYTYNEPTIFYEFMYDIAKRARKLGLKNVMVTNGYINQEPLKDILPYIDAMNIDLKSIENSYYKRFCRGSLQPVIDTIKTAYNNTHIEITTLVIDGENSDEDEIYRLSKLISDISPEIPLHLSKYYPSNRMTNPPTKTETLINLRNIAKKNLHYVYIGNVWGVDNDTYCPNCKNLLIKRFPEIEVLGLDNGHCDNCGAKIKVIY
ncbi:MAG: AmmeMemoRadiSam system radical SAM enzyme [Gudongella sp.]|nr:AmmeMemoRadiSam system radical SAM enzyme [Gudongella sp.]